MAINCFSSIFFLLLSWHFSPPDPNYYAELHHGIFPYYGFEQNDSEKLAPILNLIYTGAYRVDEEDFQIPNKGVNAKKSFFQISLSERGDSLTIEEDFPPRDHFPLSEKEIYLKNGKLVYSFSLRKDSTISDLGYFDRLQNGWLTFHSTRKTRLDSVSKDSFSLDDGIKFDNNGNILETFDRDYYGKIISKTFYKYDSADNQIEELQYSMIENLKAPEYPRFEKTKDSALLKRNAIATKEWRKAMALWEEARKSEKEVYRLQSKIINKFDSTAKSRETFQYDYDKGDSILSKHSITYFDQRHRIIREDQLRKDGTIELSDVTQFKEDPFGHLLSRIEYWNNTIFFSDYWTYDKNGRCISRTAGSTTMETTTWTYDSKGNITEYLESHNGVPSFTNRFKIYYK